MRIKEFISTKWSAYADYDNRRSLPHIMDGLKITQRKAMYTATKIPKGDKALKVSQFASKAAEATAYHHGETSMISTVVKLAQDFPGSNNYPFLEKHGQFGSRLSKESAAPRYIHTKIHDNWNKFFKSIDQEIVEHLIDDGDTIEPKFFIPILPTILLNGAEGVGNGFRTNILTYKDEHVARAINEIIKHGAVKTQLIPYVNGWHGKVTKDDKQVIMYGTLKIVNTTKIHITELPPHYDNEKFKILLNELIENKVIKEYENKSTEDKWDWMIECPRDTTSLGHDALMHKFDLIFKTTETIVCWGMDGIAPLTFNTVESLIEHWFVERIKLYEISLKHQINKITQEIILADLKMKFIEWCLNVDFRKFTKQDFIDNAIHNVAKLKKEHAEKFVAMPIFRITKDEIEKLSVEIDDMVDVLDVLESTTSLEVMKKNISNYK